MANVRSGQLILAAIFAIFVYGMIAAMLGTILPSFDFAPADAGKVAMAQALGLVLASLSAGPLADIRLFKSIEPRRSRRSRRSALTGFPPRPPRPSR